MRAMSMSRSREERLGVAGGLLAGAKIWWIVYGLESSGVVPRRHIAPTSTRSGSWGEISSAERKEISVLGVVTLLESQHTTCASFPLQTSQLSKTTPTGRMS